MSAKEFKQTAGKIIRKEIKNERNRQRENNDLNLTAKVLIMTRLVIRYLEDCIINIGNFSVGINTINYLSVNIQIFMLAGKKTI